MTTTERTRTRRRVQDMRVNPEGQLRPATIRYRLGESVGRGHWNPGAGAVWRGLLGWERAWNPADAFPGQREAVRGAAQH